MPTKRELEARIESLERRLAALERAAVRMPGDPFRPITPGWTPPIVPSVWSEMFR